MRPSVNLLILPRPDQSPPSATLSLPRTRNPPILPEEVAFSTTRPAPQRALAVDDDPAMLDLIVEMLLDRWELD